MAQTNLMKGLNLDFLFHLSFIFHLLWLVDFYLCWVTTGSFTSPVYYFEGIWIIISYLLLLTFLTVREVVFCSCDNT